MGGVDIKAIILAAGRGSRMKAFTEDVPKCLVPLCGQSLLERQIKVLKKAGINDITLVGGYKAKKLETLGLPIVINRRYAETNMVYTLFLAEKTMNQADDLIISYGDIVYEPKVLEALLICNAPLCIAVDSNWREYWSIRMDNPLEDAETLIMEEGNRVVELGKKTEDYNYIQGQYMGLIKVAGDHVESFVRTWHSMDRSKIYDGKDIDNMYMTSYLQYLIDTGWEARAALTNNGWLEVDTDRDLKIYESLYQLGRLGYFYNFEE